MDAFERADPPLRELIRGTRDAMGDVEAMYAEYNARPEVRAKYPTYGANFFPSRIGEFRQQAERLDRGLTDPEYRAGGEFANALRWYQSLAYAFDTNLSWSTREGVLLDRIAALDRLAIRVVEVQEGPAAVVR